MASLYSLCLLPSFLDTQVKYQEVCNTQVSLSSLSHSLFKVYTFCVTQGVEQQQRGGGDVVDFKQQILFGQVHRRLRLQWWPKTHTQAIAKAFTRWSIQLSIKIGFLIVLHLLLS